MKAFLGWLRYRREMNKLKRAGTFGIGGGTFLAMAAMAFFLGGWAIQPLIIGNVDIVAIGVLIFFIVVLPPIGLFLL